MQASPMMLEGRRCACGALVKENGKKCLKCRDRARWFRRKSRKHK